LIRQLATTYRVMGEIKIEKEEFKEAFVYIKRYHEKSKYFFLVSILSRINT
jgi:hypothetical protein